MKNYKILDNRPELTSEQIIKGMDFASISNNVTIAKASLLKSLIIKGVFGIIVVSSSILIYQNYNLSNPNKKQGTIIDPTIIISSIEKDSLVIPENVVIDIMPTAIVEKKIAGNNPVTSSQLSVDIASENVNANKNSETYTNPDSVKDEKTSDDELAKNDEKIKDGINSKSTNKLSRLTQCKLWKPKNYCDLPRKINLSSSYDVDAAEYDYVSCQEATKNMASMKAVWVTIKTSGRSKLQLESQLKNITLIGAKSGKLLHPLMDEVIFH